MKTVTLLIGNSDDKLSQSAWHDYFKTVNHKVLYFSREIHFSGGSLTVEKWQNYCWVFVMDESRYPVFLSWVKTARIFFNQNSVAITVGETEFI